MKLDYELSGQGEVAIIVETALGSTYAEWRPVLKPLSVKCHVLLYDRAGYGKSVESALDRSPKQIAKELHDLVVELIPDKKYILIGHSFGGLCMQQYARDFPSNVIGAIFLDPATTEERRFKLELSSHLYKKSGINKSLVIKIGLFFGRLGLLKLLKPLFKKSVPFYYYKNYSFETERDILNHLTQLKSYKAAMQEYNFYNKQVDVKNDLHLHPFPPVPVRLLLHSPQVMIDEIVNFGGLKVEEASKIDNLWKAVMENHCSELSQDYKSEIATSSGHFIHLTDQQLLINRIEDIIASYLNVSQGK